MGNINLPDGQQELPFFPPPPGNGVHFHIPVHKLQTPVFNFHQERRFHFQAAKLPCSWPLLCQKRTVADWQIELLIICCMCYRCCINEQYSITVPWHWGPWGGRLRPRSVYNLPILQRRGGGRGGPLERNHIPARRANFSDARSFLFLLPPLSPHLAAVKNDVV